MENIVVGHLVEVQEDGNRQNVVRETKGNPNSDRPNCSRGIIATVNQVMLSTIAMTFGLRANRFRLRGGETIMFTKAVFHREYGYSGVKYKAYW